MIYYPKGSRPPTQAERARAREKEYKFRLKELKRVGGYTPKADALTPYRRGRINKAYDQYKEFIHRKDKFFPVKTNRLTKSERAQVLANARALQFQTTPNAIIIERDGFQKASLAKRTRTTINKKTGKKTTKTNFTIEMEGKVKRGERMGKSYHRRIPITSADELIKVRQRLQDQADAFGPLNKNERVAFKIVERGKQDGYSKSSFSSIDELINYLNQYRKTTGEMIPLMRMVYIEKTTAQAWYDAHGGIKAKKPRKARRDRNLGGRGDK